MLTPSVPGLRPHSPHNLEVTGFPGAQPAPREPHLTSRSSLEKLKASHAKTFVKKHKHATPNQEHVREGTPGRKPQPLGVRLRTFLLSHLRLFINLSQRRHSVTMGPSQAVGAATWGLNVKCDCKMTLLERPVGWGTVIVPAQRLSTMHVCCKD